MAQIACIGIENGFSTAVLKLMSMCECWVEKEGQVLARMAMWKVGGPKDGYNHSFVNKKLLLFHHHRPSSHFYSHSVIEAVAKNCEEDTADWRRCKNSIWFATLFISVCHSFWNVGVDYMATNLAPFQHHYGLFCFFLNKRQRGQTF